MKLSTCITLIVIALSCLFCEQSFAASTEPTSKVATTPRMPLITPDNFISLWWSFESRVYSTIYSSPDSPPNHASFKLTGTLLTLKLDGTNGPSWTAHLSNNQVKSLIIKLNNVRFDPMNPIRTEYPEVLFTLIFSDKTDVDQDKNWGFFRDTAKSNLDFQKHLTQLVHMKFPDLLLVSPDRSDHSGSNNDPN